MKRNAVRDPSRGQKRWCRPLFVRAGLLRLQELRSVGQLARRGNMPIEGLSGNSDLLTQCADLCFGLAHRCHRQADLCRSHIVGRPPVRPRARAVDNPATVRSEISPRSNSARATTIPKTSLPEAVVVLMAVPSPVRTRGHHGISSGCKGLNAAILAILGASFVDLV